MDLRGRAFLFLPSVLFLFQCYSPPEVSVQEESEASWSLAAITDEPVAQGAVDSGSPQIILAALLEAYPGRITSLEIRNKDWSILVNGELFYWAEGRLLPEDRLENAEDYVSYHFKPYPEELPPLRDLSHEEVDKLEEILEQRESLNDTRFPGFMTSLWGMDDFLTAENTAIRTDFLGHNIRVHPDVKEALKRVEMRILQAAVSDEAIAIWVENLSSTGAYVWRNIAGSANRSLHSYGIAIDLIPGDYRGKQAYWRWAADFYDEWWLIPYTERFQIPREVVEAFEAEGFIWGGKWLLFDQIHFEYRPELIVLGRIAGN